MLMEDAEYCCPRCKAALTSATDAYTCSDCKEHYPIILGIPDFRVFPDPHIDIAEDRRKAQRIFERAAAADFSTLVEYYWSITPDTPPEMARRFTAQAIAAVERGRHLLHAHSAVKTKLQEPDARIVDLGTRSGGLLMAAAEHRQKAIGIDIATVRQSVVVWGGGVGWRESLGRRFVKLRKGMSYDHVCLLSVFELKHL